jgi:hypothetical protein
MTEKEDLADAIRAALEPSGQAAPGTEAATQVARVKAVLKGLDPHGDDRFRLLRAAYKEETFGLHHGRSDHHHAPTLLEWLLDKQRSHVVYVKRMVGRRVKLVPQVLHGRDPNIVDLESSVQERA